MAEFDAIILETNSLMGEYYVKENQIIHNVSFSPIGIATRMPKVYTDYAVLPMFVRMGSVDEPFERETREWDMILPFGTTFETPRREPTELIYKARKLKNPFPI